MQFDQVCASIIQESGNAPVLFVVEDMGMKQTLMRSFIQKFRPDIQIQFEEFDRPAIDYINQNKNNIFAYSLDYDLKGGENSITIAKHIQSLGNDGSNVWIHSDNPDGMQALQSIFPKAHVQGAPSNVLEILKIAPNAL